MALLRADLDTAVQAALVSLNRPSILQRYYRHRYLFALMAAALVWTIVFKYGPMYGIIIAFKRYRFFDGILGSPWVGLDHFVRLFNGTTDFGRVFRNTLLISLYRLFWGFPAPIILALLLNEVRQRQFKRTVQTISYLPHFLSWVVLGGVIRSILSPSTGVINLIITGLGGERIHFLADINWFVTVLITTGVWQQVGWGSIIFLAAIAGVDPQLHESAIVDGAGKIRQAWSITIPSIIPVIIIMFILRVGDILDAGFDQIFLLYNPAVYEVADIIDTYVYRLGLVELQYSFAAAVGLFKNVIGLILVVIVNRAAKIFGEYGLW